MGSGHRLNRSPRHSSLTQSAPGLRRFVKSSRASKAWRTASSALKHPAVLYAAVVARPDEKWGETPCAFVERKSGREDVSEGELISWCRDNLAHYKCPRHIVFSELPKTSTGKVQKHILRADIKEKLG